MRLFFSFITIVFLSSLNFANDADDVVGVWWAHGKKAKVEIYKADGKYNGKIIWLKEPNNDDGSPKIDKHNPDESLRGRPILGMDLIEGFEFDDGKWEDGNIYDPESGKTYDCVMKLKGNKLDVRGYIGLSMFGRTVTWERASK